MENNKGSVIYRAFWIMTVVIAMGSMLFLIVGDSCLMAFSINESYPVPDTALAHFVVNTAYSQIWRIILIAAYIAGVFTFILSCLAGKAKLGNFGLIIGFIASLIMGVFGYFNILYIPILVFVPFACMFTQKQLGCFLLIFELLFAIAALIFEEGGLLTGTDAIPVALFPYQLNYLGLCIYAVLAMLWFMFGQNKTVVSIIVLIIACIIEWTIFDCRTATIVLICFIVAVFVVDRIQAGRLNKLPGLIWALFRWLPLIMLGLTVVAGGVLYWLMHHMTIYDAPFFQRFIELFSFGKDYGFSAFGFNGETDSTYYYDNSYVYVLCNNGIIPLICFMIFLIMINRKIAHNRDYGLMAVATSMYVFSLMENIFCEPLFLLIAGSLLVKEPVAKAAQQKAAAFARNIHVLNMTMDNMSLSQAVNSIEKLVRAKAGKYVVNPGIDHMVRIEKNDDLKQACEKASLVLPEGQAVMWLAERDGEKLKASISGAELLSEVCEMAAKKKLSVFILGGRSGSAEAAAENLKSEYRKLDIAGTYVPAPGFMSSNDEIRKIVEAVSEKKPDIMAVSLGDDSEIFIHKYAEDLDVPVSICSGSALDCIAKGVKPCPKWMKDADLEWFYRSMKDPGRRLGRSIRNICSLPKLIGKYGKND